MVLKENQVCKHAGKCPYNEYSSCMGAQPDRTNVFECDYISNGVFVEGKSQRTIFDKTGKMNVILG